MKSKPAKKPIHQKVAAQTFTLITTSLGLVAALAWNEAITEYVNIYIKPKFAAGSGVISLFIYALVITIVTVIVSYQLGKISKKITK
ncbi:hypothetical protein A2572_04020 [Candidatus Collierbacteria bacterium RIFOXYD1_FULL_40_9]|uniref:DUF5671 domain-containing protein n=1 Tax=Candidatus Collierbacteria bacterium RIFOXYD1_FULL_40_9 TaxID=1817731 RepID=A0A1F5FWS6_9BACT|nr:MAG: hypothetical protein A2572_04020 [Candidatus Collierbacteria bacterium RIFOXYD1_FULL_40_9]